MTLQDWSPLYSRLCAGVGRKETPAQLRAYYDALSGFTAGVVTEAVKIAVSRTWPPTHPHAGDVAEIANGIRRAHTLPASACDVCHGDRMTQHVCHLASEPFDKPCGSCGLVHPAHRGGFWYARPCYQCHPASRRSDPAA